MGKTVYKILIVKSLLKNLSWESLTLIFWTLFNKISFMAKVIGNCIVRYGKLYVYCSFELSDNTSIAHGLL